MENRIKDILRKGRAENASKSERQEMLSLFHHAEKEYELKTQLLEELNIIKVTNTSVPDTGILFAKLWATIEKNKNYNRHKTRLINTFIKIAAAVIIGLFIGIYVTSVKTKQEPVYYIAHSPKGSVSEMILPDGSIIFLNADSRIKYSVEGNNGVREVFLAGEAWFDVAKKAEKPFIVHTLYYDVNVTGTQFNVKAYESDNEVTTTLEEGKIVISSSENYNIAEKITLTPGEQAVLDKGSKKMMLKEVNAKWFTSWKDNKLIFVNMSLEKLVVLLERKYGVDIEVKNKNILNLHFDGTIKNESIIEILEIIKKALPINYKIVGQKIVITAR